MLTRSLPKGIGDRNGLTFVEVVVALAVIMLIAGVTLPRVLGRLTQGQTAAVASDLSHLNAAMYAFRSDVGRYPGRLSYLTQPIQSNAKDSCGGTIPDSSVWRGPYLSRSISPAAGLAVGTAVIQDPLVREPSIISATNRTGTLHIRATGVDRGVADQLETAFDGDADLTSGAIAWTAGTGGQGTLSYSIPIRGC